MLKGIAIALTSGSLIMGGAAHAAAPENDTIAKVRAGLTSSGGCPGEIQWIRITKPGGFKASCSEPWLHGHLINSKIGSKMKEWPRNVGTNKVIAFNLPYKKVKPGFWTIIFANL